MFRKRENGGAMLLDNNMTIFSISDGNDIMK